MTPVDQAIIDEQRGDCLRCCVASILDLPRAEVPNFTDHDGHEWHDALHRFLAGRGLDLIEICFPDLATVQRTYFGCYPARHAVLSGLSPRKRPSDGGNMYHAVVGRVGGWGIKVAHDPHPSRAGLADDDEGHAVWVRFIVPATADGAPQ